MKFRPVCFTGTLVLLSALTAARAQSTWNYFISDAGGGNSLVTWNVSGSLVAGAIVVTEQSILAVSVTAPGIFTETYVASGTQVLATPDGSSFQLEKSSVQIPVVCSQLFNAPGGGNDIFALLTPSISRHMVGLGMMLIYIPGTQSALIPVDFSNFNPGTYQSQMTGFSTPITVNLTISPVPEPGTLMLAVAGGLGGLALWRRAGPERVAQALG